MAKVIPLADLVSSPTAALFEGGETPPVDLRDHASTGPRPGLTRTLSGGVRGGGGTGRLHGGASGFP